MFCLIKTCALISNSLFCSDGLNRDIFAGSQRSMSVKHGLNETNIALMSVEKSNIFQLKWVIYMPKNTFFLFKTCALISLFSSVELVTFSPAVNTQCQSNMTSSNRSLSSYPWKIYSDCNLNGSFPYPTLLFAWLEFALRFVMLRWTCEIFGCNQRSKRLVALHWTSDLSAGIQHSMPVKHGFTQPIITIKVVL